MKHHKVVQRDNPYLLSYSDLMAALLLVFILLLTVTMLKLQKELDESKDQVQRITVIKYEIIDKLRTAFEEENVAIEVDATTGAIKIADKDVVLFDSGQWILKPDAKKEIDRRMPIFFNVLLAPDFENDVTQIIIEGHTDHRAERISGMNRYKEAYIYNLKLSQNRAREVVKYILMESDYSSLVEEKGYINLKNYKGKLKRILIANGASFSALLDDTGIPLPEIPYEEIELGIFDPIKYNVGEAKSRRVEFKFRLNDEKYLEEIRDILQGIKN